MDRRIFREQEIFDLEMKHIFEKTWVYLGMASQAPGPHDFFTTWIGRHPIIVMRDGDGVAGAFLNTCTHRGARLCQARQGSAKAHVCPYHGWTFDTKGRAIGIKDERQGCYSDAFQNTNHDLVKVARFGEYRGFLFGSLNADAPDLEDYLGGTRFFLDLVVDQGAEGVELIPGTHTYTYRGNWKLQGENGLDAYHLTSTHPSFFKIVERRARGESQNNVKVVDLSKAARRGGYTFQHGHAALLSPYASMEARPLYPALDELRQRVGDERAEMMLWSRNLCLFPNVQIVENASLQLRVIRPLAPDLTEITSWCLAPKGEAPAARTLRIRQFEDFFNTTGLATPDDTTVYEECQIGFGASQVQWQQGYARGMTQTGQGGDERSARLGFEAKTSRNGPPLVQDETMFHSAYQAWLELMSAGLKPAASNVANGSATTTNTSAGAR